MDIQYKAAQEALRADQKRLREWADNQVAGYNLRFEEKLREFIRTSDDLTTEGYERFLSSVL